MGIPIPGGLVSSFNVSLDNVLLQNGEGLMVVV